MQWSNVKTFEFVCFCETNFNVSTIFSELKKYKKYVLFMKVYVPMERSILFLTKYAIIM